MTTDQTAAAIDRIPIGRSVTYAVRGVPEIADEYTERTIAPTEITLIYRSTTDSQLGRVSAYVKGWWMEDGARVPMDKPVGRWLYNGPDGWPAWLAAEARLHDPAAVSAPVQPPGTHTDVEPAVWADGDLLMEAIAAAVWEHCQTEGTMSLVVDDPRNIAAVAAAVARRLADEEQQPSGPDACSGCRYVPCGNCMANEEQPEAEAAPVTALATHAHRLAQQILTDAALREAEGETELAAYGRELAALITPDDEEQPAAEAHPPTVTWKVESPRRDQWASWGATYDERQWAQERYESAIENAPARRFRLVRATTAYTVEGEHTPAAPVAQQPATEAWVCKCPAGLCGCGHHAPVEQQPAAAYGDGKGRVYCLTCASKVAADVPLTVEDVDHWELCPSCGRHVIDVARAEQRPAAADTDEEPQP